MNQATSNNYGFKCPVKNCLKANNRRFHSMIGLTLHLLAKHPGWVEKKLKLVRCRRYEN